MEIFLAIILIILGSFGSFLAALLSTLSIEKLNSYLVKDVPDAERLHRLKVNYEPAVKGYLIFEMLFYGASLFVLSHYIVNSYDNFLYLVYGYLGLFLLIIIFRSFMHALGIRFSNILAIKMTGTLNLFYILSKPLTSVIYAIQDKIGGERGEDASRDEISALVETAMEEGSLDADEYRILKSIMHFSDVYVSDVMTPRTVMFTARADQTVESIIGLPELRMFSRLPIWEGESIDDKVVGYIMTRDVLYSALIGKKDVKLRELAQEVYFIPENVELDKALEKFLSRRQHLFVVVDEYGGVEGLLTMEDVIETILGVEIADETDNVLDLRQLAKQSRDKRIAAISQKK